MSERGCAICGRALPPTGALCAEHDAVTTEFTKKQWQRVEAMTSEQANAYLRGMADRRREKRGDRWWENR